MDNNLNKIPGIVKYYQDFNITFDKLDNILFCFAPYDVRLILERGNTKDEELFT